MRDRYIQGFRGKTLKSLGTPKHKWEDNIKMHATEICREGVDWIDLARARWRDLVNGVPIKLGGIS
jgi:hypothetical protein